MTLTAVQMTARENRITASFLPKLMAGDEHAILNEWRRIVDDPAYEPEDLSDKWAVQFGSFIEPLALDWHEKQTGQALTRRGENVTHITRPHVCATLDAWRAADNTVIDCKAIGQWRKLDEALPYYTAQMVCQRACMSAERAALLVVHGGGEPVEYPVEITPEYETAVWDRVDAFWRCIETLTPPVAMAGVAAPVPPERWHTVDIDWLITTKAEMPNWAHAIQAEVSQWRSTVRHAKDNASAAKAIKEMLPDDVGLVTYQGVRVSRAKNNAVTIREDNR